MAWVVAAAAGLAVVLSMAFWQKILAWANEWLATWIGRLFGQELREAFLMLVAAGDRLAVIVQRGFAQLQSRIVRARIFFRQLAGGREHQKVVQAELQHEDGQIEVFEQAEVVPWHELPDEVREKFIRRQTASVEIELKVKG